MLYTPLIPFIQCQLFKKIPKIKILSYDFSQAILKFSKTFSPFYLHLIFFRGIKFIAQCLAAFIELLVTKVKRITKSL